MTPPSGKLREIWTRLLAEAHTWPGHWRRHVLPHGLHIAILVGTDGRVRASIGRRMHDDADKSKLFDRWRTEARVFADQCGIVEWPRTSKIQNGWIGTLFSQAAAPEPLVYRDLPFAERHS
jgi:hypothetical protein